MFAPRVFQLFVFEHDERAANAFARFVRQDDIVDKATAASYEWVGKTVFVFLLFSSDFGGIALVFAEDDFYRAFGTHHRDLGIWPSQVHIAAQVF